MSFRLIKELMAQHMNEEQQRSLPNILGVNPGKEDVDNKEASLMSGGELEELMREEVNANELKELVAKEDESTSLEVAKFSRPCGLARSTRN